MGIIKRCILCVLCIVFCIVMCAGCGDKAKPLSPKEITDIIKSNNASDIVWTPLNANDISAYFGFSDENVTGLSVFINDDDEHYDIAAAIEFKTSEDMWAVVESLNRSLIAAKETFDNVNNSEAAKIKNKLILNNDNMLVVVVSNNYEKIGKELAKHGFVSVEK